MLQKLHSDPQYILKVLNDKIADDADCNPRCGRALLVVWQEFPDEKISKYADVWKS